jgi:glycosyltransferase involved in cell wall biosynthesis
MRILIVTDKYFPKPYANAVCAQNIADEFIRRGDVVDILGFKDDGIDMPSVFHDCNVHSVKPDIRYRLFYYSVNFENTMKGRISGVLAHIMSKTKKVFLIPWWPFYSFRFPLRIYKSIVNLDKGNKYDLIITMLQPFDGTLAGYYYKKRGGHAPWIIYAVDTMENSKLNKTLKRISDVFFWEKRFLSKCDGYFCVSSRYPRYLDKRYKQWKQKIFEVDLPMLTCAQKEIPQRYLEKKDNIEQWCYTGSIGALYDPRPLVEMFLNLTDNKKRELHFYGRGDYVGVIKHLEKMYPNRIKYHGFIGQDELYEALANADVLVSVRSCNQISAKIFDYMLYRKNIIHVSSDKNDPNKEYIQTYPLGIVIDATVGNVNNWTDSYLEQEKNIQENVDFNVRELFYKATPAYSCDMIKKVFGKVM